MPKKRKKNYKRRRTKGTRKEKYILLIVILSCAYVCGQYFCSWDWLSETVATIIAIMTAVVFWLEYHDNKLLNEAQFIIELNDQFIGDSNLSDVEWELEKFYNKFQQSELTEEFCSAFEEKFGLERKERQYLVNYLVHLEGIAALVNNGVLRLGMIDDLMSYRYFIAVNNPVVQKIELRKYSDFYKGCFAIYKDWKELLSNQYVEIPMENYDLLEEERSVFHGKAHSVYPDL